MEHLKGWDIDIKTVYGSKWKDKEKFFLSEDIWESPDFKIAGLLYRITEVGISKEAGSLAIFRNKEKPEMIFNFRNLLCWYLYKSAVQFGKDELLFVHRFIYSPRYCHIKLCALDLRSNRFALFDSIPEDFYDVSYTEGAKYILKKTDYSGSAVEETIVDLKELKWRGLTNRSNFYPDVSIIERILHLPCFLFV